MKDLIVGCVVDVIDLETIAVKVTQVVRNKNGSYNPKEIVQLETLHCGLNPVKNVKNLGYIEGLMKGKGVMCLVTGRNSHDCIKADVYAFGN